MKSLIAAAVACGVVGLMAGTETLTAQEAGEKGKEMTYTGCVAPGKDASSFMLTNVMMGDDKAAEAEKADKKGETPKMLTLSSTSVKIEPHSGHKVTVMGPTMMEKGDTKMMVTSLKMVAATCP